MDLQQIAALFGDVYRLLESEPDAIREDELPDDQRQKLETVLQVTLDTIVALPVLGPHPPLKPDRDSLEAFGEWLQPFRSMLPVGGDFFRAIVEQGVDASVDQLQETLRRGGPSNPKFDDFSARAKAMLKHVKPLADQALDLYSAEPLAEADRADRQDGLSQLEACLEATGNEIMNEIMKDLGGRFYTRVDSAKLTAIQPNTVVAALEALETEFAVPLQLALSPVKGLPEVLTFNALRDTVDVFNRTKYHLPVAKKLDPVWPLPVGAKSLDLYRKTVGVAHRRLPEPLIESDPLATLGLVLQRHTRSGYVRLLGPVSPDDSTWVFQPGIVQSECRSSNRHDRLELQQLHNGLAEWYDRVVLGEVIQQRGRKYGSAPQLTWTRERYNRELAEAACARLGKEPRHLSAADVCVQLQLAHGSENCPSESTVRGWLHDGRIPSPADLFSD